MYALDKKNNILTCLTIRTGNALVIALLVLGLVGTTMASAAPTPEKQKLYQERLEKWKALTPEQRSTILSNYKKYTKLPVEQKKTVQQNWQKWGEMAPEQKEQVREIWNNLPPEQKKALVRKERRQVVDEQRAEQERPRRAERALPHEQQKLKRQEQRIERRSSLTEPKGNKDMTIKRTVRQNQEQKALRLEAKSINEQKLDEQGQHIRTDQREGSQQERKREQGAVRNELKQHRKEQRREQKETRTKKLHRKNTPNK